MGKLFYQIGFLSTEECIELSATDLIGQYVGHTAPKTKTQLEQALGKVLVVDEAHRLADGQFATEAVNELIQFLSQLKTSGRLVVVLAGYTSDMNALMSARPALSGLFPEEIIFENIKPGGCINLLERELAKNRICAPFFQDPFSEGYRILHKGFDVLCALPSWSNAPDVKTLAKRMVVGQLDMMLELDGGDLPTLSVKNASSSMAQAIKIQQERNANQGDRVEKGPPSVHPYQVQQDDSRCAPPLPTYKEEIQRSTEEYSLEAVTHIESVHYEPMILDEEFRTSTESEGPEFSAHDEESLAHHSIREASVSDEVWAQLWADAEAANKEKKASEVKIISLEQELHNLTRNGQDMRRLEEVMKEIQRLEDARKKEEEAQRILATSGLCSYGFEWIRQGNGYRCAGGGHYMDDSQLAGHGY